MRSRIQATVDELLRAIDPTRPFDVVSTLTFPLPATIVFSFMGVPERDWAQLKAWCGSRASLGWGRPAREEQIDHATNMAAYRGYLRQLVAAKDAAHGDDFASALLEIHDEDPEALTHEEIASILFSLSFAGHETTNYLIGNLVRRLLEERSRSDAVRDDPALIAGAVDEILRYDTGVGASLGKLEARLAVEGLVSRWPGLELVPGQEIPFHPNISFRGPLELWVSVPASA